MKRDLVLRFEQTVGRAMTGPLDARLAALVARARSAHPSVVLHDDAFVMHLAKHLAEIENPDEVLDTACIEDLYLACACGLGDAAAIAILERDWFSSVASYVGRIESSKDFVAEVCQLLRIHLLTTSEGRAPRIADYAGRGPLGGWLRVAAVRLARSLSTASAKNRGMGDDEGVRSARTPSPDPERAFLREHYAWEINRALDSSLASLSDRDRTLLRLYFVEGMSLASIGRMIHVHETTVLRRITTIRETVLDRVKDVLRADSRDLESRLALVGSQLDLHFSRHLKMRGSD